MQNNEKCFINMMSIAVIALIMLPVGIACVILGFGMGDSPCVMCWAERITMIAIALIGLFIVRYGPKRVYLASLIFMACWGMFNGFIHYSIDGTFGGYLDIGQGFGLEIFGAHTQFWVIVVDFFVLVFLALILFMSRNFGEIMHKSENKEFGKYIPLTPTSKFAHLAFIAIVALNCLQAFITSGPPPHLGSSTPPRMSLNPDKWFWEQDHWESPFDFRFDWDVEKPELVTSRSNDLVLQADAGAIKNIKFLTQSEKITLNLGKKPLTGLDLNKKTGTFAISANNNGFYVTDANFNALRYARHDKHFIMEMEDSVGATWYKDEVSIISYNKTFVSYLPTDIIDKDEQNSQWRHLIDGYDKFKLTDFGNKNRFFTLRAKQQYILDFDYDEATNKYLIASVPSKTRPSWSVAILDGDDKMIVEEYVPSIGVELKDGKTLDDYYITGVELDTDYAYLLSKNYSSILKLDLKAKQIVDAFAFTGVSNPRAITIRDNKFLILSREKDENIVFVFNMPVQETLPAKEQDEQIQSDMQNL
ncbi:hypothetical protein LMG7974_00134 [Campylobacter majalis]|uniref:Disulfide bond formation protein B n=1 Tax=Campylobacter majalis TaxID=2790656 RepID=A0ABM8Q224_9BACT|nr:disulfide bond formation protein B [Campylobacter majalis]CAD7286888.1 hypothetical protein LMG7974_00134 [Campylobacter majalis]